MKTLGTYSPALPSENCIELPDTAVLLEDNPIYDAEKQSDKYIFQDLSGTLAHNSWVKFNIITSTGTIKEVKGKVWHDQAKSDYKSGKAKVGDKLTWLFVNISQAEQERRRLEIQALIEQSSF